MKSYNGRISPQVTSDTRLTSLLSHCCNDDYHFSKYKDLDGRMTLKVSYSTLSAGRLGYLTGHSTASRATKLELAAERSAWHGQPRQPTLHVRQVSCLPKTLRVLHLCGNEIVNFRRYAVKSNGL